VTTVQAVGETASREVCLKRIVAAALLAGAAAGALADEAGVRRLVESKLRYGAAVQEVRKLPSVDLYEVVVRSPKGPLIYYVDGAATVVIAGNVIDGKTGRDLTEERLRQLTAIEWGSLPFASAITTVRGNGRRKIAVFSDPNCPYCKRFEATLAKLDDITVYVFLFPVISAESVPLARSVWCSEDRARAWNELMLRGVAPSAAPDCDTPVEKLVALGHRLGASSTPTWFLENGQRYDGAMSLEDVRELLDQASPRK
jgi:thiol:disulfide interchange protein DsbC